MAVGSVVCDTNDKLSKFFSLEQADKCLWCALQPIDNILAEFDPALLNPRLQWVGCHPVHFSGVAGNQYRKWRSNESELASYKPRVCGSVR